jgi:hypothetical protein
MFFYAAKWLLIEIFFVVVVVVVWLAFLKESRSFLIKNKNDQILIFAFLDLSSKLTRKKKKFSSFHEKENKVIHL